MKNFRVILLGGIFLCSWSEIMAQSTAETALLFSRVSNGGSARVMGMGGASVSLGGDFTAASANPAGLAMFNRSEFTFSPNYSWVNSNATYFDTKTSSNRSHLAIPALSFAFQNPKNQGGWISSTFAISLTRLNDFHSNLDYEGRNVHNAIGDYFANDSYGIDPNTFTSADNSLNRLAYDNYLIDPYYDANNNEYYYGSAAGINIDNPNDVPHSTQRETKATVGAQNQWSASYSANIDDKFFFGASLHLRSIRFESKSSYTESGFTFPGAGSGYDPINTVLLEEKLKITGSGFSATLGAIVRPIDGLQVGAAINTPTVYTMSDVYSGRIATAWNNFPYDTGTEIIELTNYDHSTDDVLSDYKLKTPGRLSLGASYFFNKKGFISGDIEFVNFAGAKYTSKTEGLSYNSDNVRIKSIYRGVPSFRLGGEYRLNEYRFRGGIAGQSDPFAAPQNGVHRSVATFSCGAGIRKESFSVDVALNYATGKNSYRPYSVPGDFSPLVKYKTGTTNFMVTVGLPFR
jgi:hypothetical protein